MDALSLSCGGSARGCARGGRRERGAVLLACVLAVWMIAAGGCRSALSTLDRESDFPELVEWSRLHNAEPHEVYEIPTQGQGGETVLAVHWLPRLPEESDPDADGGRKPRGTIVLVHGFLGDCRGWRFLAGELRRDHNVLMPELPGCGESMVIPSAKMDSGCYSPAALACRVAQSISASLDRARIPDSEPVTLVAHSLGGAAVLRLLADPDLYGRHAPLIARIDRVVLLAPLDVSVEKADSFTQRLATVSSLEIGLGGMTGVLERSVCRGIRESVDEGKPALRCFAEEKLDVLRDSRRRRAMQMMLRDAVPRRPGDVFSPRWDEIDRISSLYANISTPTLIIWGAHDQTLPLSMGYKLHAQLPRSTLRVLPRCRHSPQSECTKETAALIREFEPPRSDAGSPAAAGDSAGP